MRQSQDIVYGVTGQLVYFDAPEGRPSSVTRVDVFRWDVSDDDIAEAALGTGSVESDPATTLDGSAGPSQSNPRNIPLTATTGIAAGRTYLITHATSGLKEWVEVEGITSADSVTVKHPLHNDYASSATFQSTRIKATVDSTWVADETNLRDNGPNSSYRVRWVYVVGGVTYVADTYFTLVRYAGAHGVRPQDIETMMPGWLNTLPTDHRVTQGRNLIDEAYRGVKLDVRKVDIAASGIAESEVVDELVRYKTVALGEYAKLLAGGGSSEAVQLSKQQYQDQLDSIIRVVSRIPVRDTTGAATAVVAAGLSRR